MAPGMRLNQHFLFCQLFVRILPSMLFSFTVINSQIFGIKMGLCSVVILVQIWGKKFCKIQVCGE